MNPRRTLLLACAALAVFAAACGGDDEPSDDGSAAGPPVVSEVPTATPFAERPAPTIVSGREGGGPGGVETTYQVESGDTPSGIAERFEVSVEALFERNGLSSDDFLVPGQTLIIPAPDDSSEVVEGEGDASDDSSGDDGGDADSGETDGGEADGGEAGGTTAEGDYIVAAGDTAYGIALQFGITVEELAAANGVTVDEIADLQAGDELVIPGQ